MKRKVNVNGKFQFYDLSITKFRANESLLQDLISGNFSPINGDDLSFRSMNGWCVSKSVTKRNRNGKLGKKPKQKRRQGREEMKIENKKNQKKDFHAKRKIFPKFLVFPL